MMAKRYGVYHWGWESCGGIWHGYIGVDPEGGGAERRLVSGPFARRAEAEEEMAALVPGYRGCGSGGDCPCQMPTLRVMLYYRDDPRSQMEFRRRQVAPVS